MTETQKRIKAYKAALPGLRERVTAVALLLVMSLTMLTSASFAWYTLSHAPEVNGMATTVAANGSLEIALAEAEGNEPPASTVGDSSIATKSVVESNITWGNLVNLSDTSYGLSNIVLRPAQLGLNFSDLLEKPLIGLTYGADGRALSEKDMNFDFEFTNWYVAPGATTGYFRYYETPQYGVRAISTVHEEIPEGADEVLYTLVQNVENAYTIAEATYFNDLVGNQEYMSAITGLISVYLDVRMNGGAGDVTTLIPQIFGMMETMDALLVEYGEVVNRLATVQVFKKVGNDYENNDYDSVNDLLKASAEELKNKGISLESIESYRTILDNYNRAMYGTNPNTNDCIKDFYNLAKSDTAVTWANIAPYINIVVNIDQCQVDIDGDVTAVKDINRAYVEGLLGDGIFGALAKLGNIRAYITAGMLKDFEQMSGMKMYVTGLSVELMSMPVTAQSVTTNASEPYDYKTDLEAVQSGGGLSGSMDKVAEETYGLAMDLWVRTNAEDSYLVLEGNVITRDKAVPDQGEDIRGNDVDLYTVTIVTQIDEEGNTETREATVYQESGSGTWRYAEGHSPLYGSDNATPPLGQTISEPIQKLKIVQETIDYQGENRIWTEVDDLNSTTQGGGSCYVFYAENPDQQDSCLRLLSNMYVAFVDSTPGSLTAGHLVGLARFDTENVYDSAGRVVVPMVLTDNEAPTLTYNEEELAIIELEQNVPVRLTAIVFLDGQELSNSEVMAASEMQGRLNIQFASTESLQALGDRTLQQATRTVSAQAKKTGSSSYQNPIQFTYGEDGTMKVDVAVTVEGEQPQTMTAFFMRKVNDNQGSRQKSFILEPGEDGVWVGTHEFDAPGNYVLQTVQLDGMDYDLPVDGRPQVEIAGLAIKNVTCLETEGKKTGIIMTGDTSSSTNLTVEFASSEVLAKSVQLQFREKEGQVVTANLAYDSATQKWSGKANFTTSGVYTLTFVVIDGNHNQLDEQFQYQLTVYVGMKVRVWDTGMFNQLVYGEVETPVAIPVYVEIFDNTGKELSYLENVKLNYSSGSTIQGMDPTMTWDSQNGWYSGQFQLTDLGMYTFRNVQVGSNILTSTMQTPPTYTFMSPDPPVYYDAAPMADMDYVLDTRENTTQVGVRIANADAAMVSAELLHTGTVGTRTVRLAEFVGRDDTQTEVIDGESVSTFLFNLPKNAEGYHHGDWTITKLLLANVYDEDRNFHDTTDPLEIDLTTLEDDDKAELSVRVFSVKVEVEGKNEDHSGLAFLQPKTTANHITINITDQNGEKLIFPISNVKLHYGYETTTSSTYGGYAHTTVKNYTLESATSQVLEENKKFEQELLTLQYAGLYSPSALTFDLVDEKGKTVPYTINSGNDWYDNTLPVYTLSTVTPSVEISSVSLTGTYYTFDDSSYKQKTVTLGTTEVTVYHKAQQEQLEVCGVGLTTYYNYTPPKVTLELKNAGHANGATLTFSSTTPNNMLYTGPETYGNNSTTTGNTSDYVWENGATEVWRWVGYCKNQDGGDTRTAAGSLEADTLVLTDGTNEFSVNLGDNSIKINNPH